MALFVNFVFSRSQNKKYKTLFQTLYVLSNAYFKLPNSWHGSENHINDNFYCHVKECVLKSKHI